VTLAEAPKVLEYATWVLRLIPAKRSALLHIESATYDWLRLHRMS
jgi:hypothetical protein